MNAFDTLTITLLQPGDGSRVLVVLPSLGTAAGPLWRETVEELPGEWTIAAVDLPGHGESAPVTTGAGTAVTVAQLSEAVLAAVREAIPSIGAFAVAGDSVGGAIALQLALDRPDVVEAAAPFCTGAKIGVSESWEERAAHVEANGTASMVEGSKGRWFAPGYLDAQPERAAEMLDTLEATDDLSYAAVCRAIASFDIRPHLGDITVPVLAVAGEHDQPTPPASLQEIADGVQNGRLEVVGGAAHLVPVEDPAAAARLLADFLG